jgi:AcrR family transcriptional regulator
VADEAAEPGEPSRRQAHKLRTERALQQAALALFGEQGYDTTTTDEIAERAGVSPRTFFRYFPTKESVLFVGEYGWLQSFNNAFLAQPEDLSDLDAMRATLHTLAPDLTKRRAALVLYEKAVSSSPTLRGGVFDHQQQDIAAIAGAIATRRDLTEPDLACLTLATVMLLTYRNGVMRWLSAPASADIRDFIAEGFDLLVAELAPAPPTGRRRGVLRSAAR